MWNVTISNGGSLCLASVGVTVLSSGVTASLFDDVTDGVRSGVSDSSIRSGVPDEGRSEGMSEELSEPSGPSMLTTLILNVIEHKWLWSKTPKGR